MRHSYSFPILLTSLLFVTIALSALNTQVPLWLVREDFSLGQIGLVGSSYFTGNLVGTIMANWFISRFNARYTYTYSCLIFAVATIGLSFSMDFYSWAIWRFFIGIACAVTWVVIESCILVTGSVRTRGKMLAIYLTTYYLGTVLGQALLQYFPQDVLYFGLVIALLMGLAILFILLTHYKLPKRKQNSFNIIPMILYKPSRLGLIGCMIAGMLIGSLYSLMPAYYSHLGYSNNQVANWMILLILSGVIAQMPANYCADKYGRRIVLLIESLLTVVACLMLVFNFYSVLAIILLGTTIYTIYPISMAWACSCVRKQEIVTMNQAMLLTNTIGSLIAPAIIAFIMDMTNNTYLFVSFAIISLYFVVLLLRERATDA
ncbi:MULTISPECIES: MFS transporter [unclassified Gilliamella]|uniref:MFS transporter n=1 Tax=unclassified Gilliamella TaxID=2685620 RepID=UPI002269A9C4|nr:MULTISPECIES: MFS transporter [unclassified Gilliamella]MCX8600700.1 MFS transporter [Gilliamella sp. B3722]MCX8609240.1 MFS transporter [Gilliamella sp. B3771]MCX8609917.1 MFS transporter [Gilliamella sp. B3891]MCX8611993.1 MFS transporter [Gilliamella sp. B3773]MCX8615497.1 MFS transporter [Gilliamella sp. B3770]